MNNFENKKVSIPLAIGIFLIPLIFAWFTLRKGYSKTARMISFGWLILGFVAFAFLPAPPKSTADNTTQEHAAPTELTEQEKTAKADKERLEFQEQNKKQLAALANEDKPQFEAPTVDYTSPVAKVDLKNDEEIIASVGLPVVEKESGANQNGEPMTTYYFSEDLLNGLELSLSREFVDVAWKYDASNTQKAYAVFDDGQRISRALLGGQDGAALYEKISEGSKIESVILNDGTEIQNARCGESMCRYQVVR